MSTFGAELLPSRVALDTSTYSQLRRGESRAIDVVARAEIVFVSTTALGELEAGFRVGNRYNENRRDLEDFLREPYVEITDIDPDVSRRYGEVYVALRRAGTPIPVNDIWIAAATFTSGAHLVTFDADFSKVEGLPHTLFR